jgi:hypothetical protein
MCGLGRTGRWFAADHWNVVPDIITMAKGLTSAYLPLGAVAVSKSIASYFDRNVFYGGLTYNAHPMSLAAAEACVQVMIDDDTMGHTQRMGRVLSQLHAEMKEKHPSVGDVRSIGLFGVLELVRNRETKEPMAPFNGTSPEMQRLGAFLREHGMYAFINWNNLFTNPPLCITEDQLRESFAIIDRGLEITDGGLPRGLAILSIREPDGAYPYRRALLVDVIASLRDRALLRRVVDAATAAAAALGADSLTCMHTHPLLMQALKEAGFYLRPPTRYLLVDAGRIPAEEAALLTAGGHWHLTQSDADIDRPGQ